MSNSSLVSYTRISPNRTVNRNHSIDRITPHCYVGQVTVESMASWLCNPSASASSNYGIGVDGRVGLFVEEKDRSWCSSSGANDHRAVTIECASNTSGDYAINGTVYNKLIELMTDICKRNGKNKLIWFGDKLKTLNYAPASNEMVITVHRWFANKACPGDYIYSRLGTIATEVTRRLNGIKLYRIRRIWANADSQVGAYENKELAIEKCPVGYSVFDDNGKVIFTRTESNNSQTMTGIPTSKGKFIEVVGSIAKTLYKDTNILPSVVTAQCCLETGYGLGKDALELVERNNLLGMKAELLNTTWKDYTVWDGKTFIKRTPEVYNGKTVYINDKFRIYPDYRTCILDYEMFLLNVKNNGNYKYRKVASMTSPQEVITAISKGGYATDPSYITKVLQIISENKLEKFDEGLVPKEMPKDESDTEIQDYYRVQVGAFKLRANANKRLKEIQDAGFSAIIKQVDNNYKVQVGAFKLRVNAEKRLKEIKAAGFKDAFITP